MATIRRRAFLASSLGVLAAPAVRAQEGPVRIAVLNDQSGVYADIAGPGSVVAARLAVEDFGGRVGSMPVEVVVADHQNRPDVGATIARQWFDRDGVGMVIDCPQSAVALAVAEIARDKNRVFIGSGAASADLTGRACSPNTVHWTMDNVAIANTVGKAIVAAGGRSWFFITADYAFGQDLEAQVSTVVRAAGGEIVGGVRHPLGATDFSSFLLQAQRSRAQIIGLANGGGDTINSVRQAAEFGIVQRGQKLASLLIAITDIHALGLTAAQGLQFTEAFYWDLNDGTRAWSRRFAPLHGGRMPGQVHAGVYGGITHYLKAVRQVGSARDGAAVVRAMKAMGTDDPLFGRGTIRADGRKLHDMFLFEAKAPTESTAPWDYYKLVRTVPPDEAFRPIDAARCNFAP
jgi:branched-chain amino acid transport system substrate-binding protein